MQGIKARLICIDHLISLIDHLLNNGSYIQCLGVKIHFSVIMSLLIYKYCLNQDKMALKIDWYKI